MLASTPTTWWPDGDARSYGDPLTGSFASVSLASSLGDLETFVERVSSTGLIQGEPVRVDERLIDEFETLAR